jgi:hypothetical protein
MRDPRSLLLAMGRAVATNDLKSDSSRQRGRPPGACFGRFRNRAVATVGPDQDDRNVAEQQSSNEASSVLVLSTRKRASLLRVSPSEQRQHRARGEPQCCSRRIARRLLPVCARRLGRCLARPLLTGAAVGHRLPRSRVDLLGRK